MGSTLEMQGLITLSVYYSELRNPTRLPLAHFSYRFPSCRFHVHLKCTVAGIRTARTPNTTSELTSESQHFLSEVVSDMDHESPVGSTALTLETRRLLLCVEKLKQKPIRAVIES